MANNENDTTDHPNDQTPGPQPPSDKPVHQRALEVLSPASLARLSEEVYKLLKAKLWLQVLVAMALGIGTGLALNPSSELVDPELANTLGEWFALPGYFFLAIIQMIIVPLVFASIIRGIAANQDMDQLRRTGTRLLLYFLFTTIVSVSIGIALGLIIKPGDIPAMPTESDTTLSLTPEDEAAQQEEGFSWAALPSDLVNVLPQNPLDALVQAEMLQIVIFAIVVALALVSLSPTTAKPLLELLGATESIAIAVVRWVMLITPWAVFGLLARTLIHTGPEVLSGLGWYVASAMIGFVLLLGFYMLMLFLLGRRNPFQFFGKITEPLLLAFSVNSSAATMPLTLKTAEEKLKIKPSTARFVIPLGTTINMDSTALNQGLATIFLAQLSGFD
ncbi:MAG: dicarboxylate/amino acid:cation symporter, partial [Bacteroidota bacterium]